jgi:hypothetical protein
MTAEGTLRFIRHCLGLFLSLSIQGAASVSVGGALAYAAILAGAPVYYLPFALLFGMAVPQWPLRVFFSPDRELERKFRRWDRWVEKGYLTPKQCKELKNQFRRWYISQLAPPRISPESPASTPGLEHDQDA